MKSYYSLKEVQQDVQLIEMIVTCILNHKRNDALQGMHRLVMQTHIFMSQIEQEIYSNQSGLAIKNLSRISSALTNQACKQNNPENLD